MPATAIVAISRKGADLARALAAGLEGDKTLYLDRRFAEGSDDAVPFGLPLRPLIQRVFGEYQRLVLFMPVGAAVRLLAPCLQDKGHDPAVVCVDDAGRFAVSLLSGHVGGADRLAEEVSQVLDATPVITSASHVMGTLAVDLLGQQFGWRLEADPLAVTRASAAVVNGEPVGVYQEAGEPCDSTQGRPGWWPQDQPLPANIQLYPSLETLAGSSCVAALIITDHLVPSINEGRGGFETRPYEAALKDKIVVVYRPRSLVVGLGCRRGVPVTELEELLMATFRQYNLAVASLRCIATAELKRDEAGIQQLAERYGVPVYCYTAQELNRQFDAQPPPNPPSPPFSKGGMGGFRVPPEGSTGPTRSAVAYRLLGMWGVSEPAALLAADSRELLVPRQKTARATVAVARMSFGWK
jgi:cobalt-precorrin 5A hydrolase